MSSSNEMRTFRAPDDEFESWKRDSDRRGLKMSEWIREACRSFYQGSPFRKTAKKEKKP